MFRLTPHTPILHTPRLALAAAIAFGLSGCGGGAADSLGNASRSATLANAEQPQDAQPHFHIAPVLLDQPTSMDADGSEASAHEAAASQAVLARLEHVSSARLELETLKRKTEEVISQEGPKPATSTSTVASVYTPAQIRAAYQLPPMAGVNLTGNPALGAATAAQFGSGQTIYIIDAYNDPNVASDLAQFSAQWGLPTCTRLTIAASTKLPLAAAPAGSGCEFAVVYASQSGVLSASVPAYSSGWAPEISLDTQWSHAIAPMARIILIEAQDASSPSILGAIKLANSLGPGVVSMSFGSPEGSYVPSYDGMFTTKGMSYVASTGDSGVGVAWPAVSTNVLGVGGTSLTLGSNNVRSETAWNQYNRAASELAARLRHRSQRLDQGDELHTSRASGRVLQRQSLHWPIRLHDATGILGRMALGGRHEHRCTPVGRAHHARQCRKAGIGQGRDRADPDRSVQGDLRCQGHLHDHDARCDLGQQRQLRELPGGRRL